MSIAVLNHHIEQTPGIVGGKPRIAGRRITVQNIAIWHEYLGMSSDEIAAEYDLTLADVHAALTYYFDHRSEIEQSIRDDKAFVEALKSHLSSPLKLTLNEPAPVYDSTVRG